MDKQWSKAGKGRGSAGSRTPSNRNIVNCHNIKGKDRNRFVSSAQARFKDISDQHEKDAKKVLRSFEDYYESSSEEEDLDDSIFFNITKSYEDSQLHKVNADDENGNFEETSLGFTSQYLTECCQAGAITCLVCISSVKRQNEIWNCEKCFAIFHLNCIRQWVLEGVAQASLLSDEYFPNRDQPWYCPKCRNEYSRSKCPESYYCFCGNVKNPPSDPWLLPHSCGNSCNKLLKNPGCEHHCLLLCHPGPCPPCPQTVKLGCHCGKKQPTTRRCGSGKWSCGGKCEKLLSCNRHNCEMTCHSGECIPCSRSSTQPCYCGVQKHTQPCAQPQWSCGKICNQLLSCGSHCCEKTCHKIGECGDCPNAGVRTCPCGKQKYNDLSCTQEAPLCKDTCGKNLGCFGNHKCSRRCHVGPCESCPLMTMKTCRCGKRKREVQCQKEYFCETKCLNLRSCGRHQCKRKCCIGRCPPCEQICGRSLQCKKHKCQMLCHQGACYPCPLTSKITCNCGNSVITVVCGKERATKPPRCRKLCEAPSVCHHPNNLSHNCHFGDCPKCKQVCGQTVQCGHICPEQCHDNVVVKNEVKAAAPWELPQSSFMVKKLDCPPCKVPISVLCRGKHDTSEFACSEVRDYSCGRKCGRTLKCFNHQCELECHAINTDDTAEGSCHPCERPCSNLRPPKCTHECISLCHPGDCPPCRKRIRMKCHCGMVSLKQLCCEWSSGTKDECNRMQSCGNHCPKTLSPCGHMCYLQCHPGDCPSSKECGKKVVLRCPCKRKKKDYVCSYVHTKDITMTCDDICTEIKTAKAVKKEREENLKREEEKRQQQEEVEKFERKINRRSRVRKHCPSDNEKNASSLWKRFLLSFAGSAMPYVAIFLGIIACIVYTYYLSEI